MNFLYGNLLSIFHFLFLLANDHFHARTAQAIRNLFRLVPAQSHLMPQFMASQNLVSVSMLICLPLPMLAIMLAVRPAASHKQLLFFFPGILFLSNFNLSALHDRTHLGQADKKLVSNKSMISPACLPTHASHNKT